MKATTPLSELARCRRRWTREERQQWLDGYRKSGLGRDTFCEQHGLSRKRFLIWLRKEKREMPRIVLQELPKPTLPLAGPIPAMEISIAPGVQARIFNGCEGSLLSEILKTVCPCGR